MNEYTLYEFLESINKSLITFKDPKLEASYAKERQGLLKYNKPFLSFLIILFIVLTLRDIEEFIFMLTKEELIYVSKAVIIIKLSLLVASLLYELIAIKVERLEHTKGIALILFIFITNIISSYSFDSSGTGFVPTYLFIVINRTMPSYIFATVINLIYINHWIIVGIGCIIGLIFQIVFNHLRDYHLCKFNSKVLDELFTFDVMYMASYGMLFFMCFIVKYKNRYDYYVIYKYTEIKQSYKELLLNFPFGIIVFDSNTNPLFCNCIFTDWLPGDFASSNCNLEEQEGLTKELVLDTLENFVPHESNTTSKFPTLRNLIEHWPHENTFETGKFVCTTKNQNSYMVKGLMTIFHKHKCKVLIFQDQNEIDRLQKLNETYQRLYVASIAHDIRTPLNGIIGMLDMMSEIKEQSKAVVYISVAKSACKLLLYLTYNITDYSQLEASKFKVNNDKVKIKEIIDEVSQLFSFSFQKKNLSLNFVVDVDVPKICSIDKNRYMQIILNIISNALKFTIKGGVTVTIAHNEHKDLLITSIKDTGIGIKPEEVPKLFKLFGKLENSTLNPQGVGFGLVICKQLSESLGGHIEVDSAYGEGSTFTFAVGANTFTELRKTTKVETTKIDLSDVPKLSANRLKKAKTVIPLLILGTICLD